MSGVPCYNGLRQPKDWLLSPYDASIGDILTAYLNVVQIIVSLTLIALAVMQGKGAGLSRMFGGDSSVYRTRRGVEKTVFNITIILAVVFFLTSLLSVLLQS